MKWNGMLCIVAIFAMLAGCGNEDQPPLETQKAITSVSTEHEVGKKLFYAKCASCHMVNKEMTGPALKGVEGRWTDKEKLYAFIKNSEAVIASDKYARDLWLKYNQTAMLPHPDLTNENIRSILDYVQAVSIGK